MLEEWNIGIPNSGWRAEGAGCRRYLFLNPTPYTLPPGVMQYWMARIRPYKEEEPV
jgi:hypothetical protein